MIGVDGKNPVNEGAISYKKFKNGAYEKDFLVKEIKEIFRKNSDATIGILVRNNYQVENYISFLQDNDICAIAMGENLSNKRIFKIVFSILKISENPFVNKHCEEAAKLIYPNKKFEILNILQANYKPWYYTNVKCVNI